MHVAALRMPGLHHGVEDEAHPGLVGLCHPLRGQQHALGEGAAQVQEELHRDGALLGAEGHPQRLRGHRWPAGHGPAHRAHEEELAKQQEQA